MHTICVLIAQILQYFSTALDQKYRGGLMMLEEFSDDSVVCSQVL